MRLFVMLCIAFGAVSACVHPLPTGAQKTCLDPTYTGHDAYVAAVEACIRETSAALEALPPRSARRVPLLLERATLYQTLTGLEPARRDEAFRAALANYDAAVAIEPHNDKIRYKRAWYLLGEPGREDEVLKEAELLIGRVSDSVEYRRLRGLALAELKRDNEAIADFTLAMKLAGSCAEASAIQRMANEFRHHYDPPPPCSEERRRSAQGNSVAATLRCSGATNRGAWLLVPTQ